MKSSRAKILWFILSVATLWISAETTPPKLSLTHARIGDMITSSGGELAIRCIDRRAAFGRGDTYDPDIQSPKSVAFSPDGKKLYVNSLEGCKTVVYDAATRKKLKVIEHRFESGEGPLWLRPSGFYPFSHYPDGARKSFRGKPVEEAFSPDGHYFFVPYYRRDFDINAQDPSAMAVIDTRTDEIVMLVETGPLPKMVRVSNDGKLVAITHWGNNTVGFLDISHKNPEKWRHLPPVTIGKKLELDYSLTTPVNRDSGSGLLLRGTVFLPGDSLLLVSGMAGSAAVIDLKKMLWIGSLTQLSSVRHIVLKGNMLYFSRNVAGEVMTLPVAELVKAIREQKAKTRDFKVSGLRSVKVGGGARTLDVSPSGKYIFVACNTASHIYVVKTDEMKVIGSIAADSFPVGLDVSPDGQTIATTSQGRKGSGGGNSLNFFNITYREAEPSEVTDTSIIAPEDSDEESTQDTTAPSASPDNQSKILTHESIAISAGVLLLILLILLLLVIIRGKHRFRQ